MDARDESVGVRTGGADTGHLGRPARSELASAAPRWARYSMRSAIRTTTVGCSKRSPRGRRAA